LFKIIDIPIVERGKKLGVHLVQKGGKKEKRRSPNLPTMKNAEIVQSEHKKSEGGGINHQVARLG